jgi:hypothetical protein
LEELYADFVFVRRSHGMDSSRAERVRCFEVGRSLLDFRALCCTLELKDSLCYSRQFMVGRCINTLLTWLIISCPFVCGADFVGHSLQHGDCVGESESEQSPVQCPESSDNCVCQGAVQSSGVRATSPFTEPSVPLFHMAPSWFVAHPANILSCDFSHSGLASRGDSLTVRALLQNYRC